MDEILIKSAGKPTKDAGLGEASEAVKHGSTWTKGRRRYQDLANMAAALRREKAQY
jgi:hypothetical protein